MAKMGANHEEMMASLKRLNATADAWLENMEACLEKEEPAPEETEAVEEPQKVPEGATDEETFGATEDRAGEQRARHNSLCSKFNNDIDNAAIFR
jgi:hypothetical protein